jgi:hypothetical protein
MPHAQKKAGFFSPPGDRFSQCAHSIQLKAHGGKKKKRYCLKYLQT